MGPGMNKFELNIKAVMDIPEWEKIQDQFAKLTGTAIMVVDYKGNPVSKHSGRTDFCTVIRENPISRKRCYKCDALAGIEAVRLNKPFVYLCHCGIVDVSIPVVVGDRYLGAVMFGQVRIPNNDTDTKVDRLIDEISTTASDVTQAEQDLLEMYNRLPEMEYQRIVELADMLDVIIKYIINRFQKSHSDLLGIEQAQTLSSLPPMFDGEGKNSEDRLREISNLQVPPHSYEYAEETLNIPTNSPIYPAVAHIENNRRERAGMQEMAKLCHLSAGYFSKLFLKETGENYNDYLNRKKITWAREALRNTDENINMIAMNLGFQDTSYFVKVFKKYTNMTPSQYRRNCQQL